MKTFSVKIKQQVDGIVQRVTVSVRAKDGCSAIGIAVSQLQSTGPLSVVATKTSGKASHAH